MIIYEVSFVEVKEQKVFGSVCKTRGSKESAYFSNRVKAKSFVAKNRGICEEITIKRYVIHNSKSSVIKFLNRNGIG